MNEVIIRYSVSDALGMMAAVDSAEVALMLRAEQKVISDSERDHALIMFRKLRSDLLRSRADVLQQILDKRKT